MLPAVWCRQEQLRTRLILPEATTDNSRATAASFQTTGFYVWRPGRLTYRDALVLQEDLVDRRTGWDHDLLLLLEHPPVVTFGRSADHAHLRWSEERCAAIGLDIVDTQRGGDVTLHSPGQLVGYPIVDLNRYQRDLHDYLRKLEQVLLNTLAIHKLEGYTLPGKTGVWVGGRKIASIGVAVRRWITWHGFALNVNNDLDLFDAIVPCGLNDVTMTSLQEERGQPVTIDMVAATLVEQFAKIFASPFLGELPSQP